VRFPSLALSVVLLAAAVDAEAAGAKYAPCTKAPSASDIDGAKGLHLAAKQYLSKGAYDQAIQTWLQAYNFDCTKPEVFINIGKSYEGLGRIEDAVEAYQTYADRKGPLADGVTLLKLKTLRDGLEAKRRAEGTTPKRDSTPESAPVAETTWKSSEPALTSEPASRTSAGPEALPWVLVGLGGALATAGGVLLGVGGGKVSDAEAVCPERNCDVPGPGFTPADVAAAQESGNQGLTLQRAGTGVLIGGLGVAAGGVVWYLVARSSESEASTALRVLPIVSPGSYGLTATMPF
jgi:hypothetical protein